MGSIKPPPRHNIVFSSYKLCLGGGYNAANVLILRDIAQMYKKLIFNSQLS